MKYISFFFTVSEQSNHDILVAYLDAIGFAGFEERENCLVAFIIEKDFSQETFDEVINLLQPKLKFSYHRSEVENRNWNAEWEAGFQPIVIEDAVCVRASFHPPVASAQYDIVIDPRMTFGTGHHATTSMMMQLMLRYDFRNKKVLDFGCGTGILSILASRLGASEIIALDNDMNAVENAMSNFLHNDISNAHALFLDQIPDQCFDIILANITLNVIMDNFSSFTRSLDQKGVLFLSGLLLRDENSILSYTKTTNFILDHILKKDGWLAAAFLL